MITNIAKGKSTLATAVVVVLKSRGLEAANYFNQWYVLDGIEEMSDVDRILPTVHPAASTNRPPSDEQITVMATITRHSRPNFAL